LWSKRQKKRDREGEAYGLLPNRPVSEEEKTNGTQRKGGGGKTNKRRKKKKRTANFFAKIAYRNGEKGHNAKLERTRQETI